MDDGNTASNAESDTTNPDTQIETANTCDGTNLGDITKVEIRAYAACGENITADRQDLRLTPKFDGSNGDAHEQGDTAFNPAWLGYFDITSDTNAPVTWDWDDVVALDMTCYSYGVRKTAALIARIDIRVTHRDKV